MVKHRQQLLELVADLTERTDTHILLLEAMIDDDQTSPEYKVELGKIIGTLMVQNKMMVESYETMLRYEDVVEKFKAALNK